MPQSRQLAAIMFTDIVGYTALMGKDSKKALELIEVSKQIQQPLVEKHNGEWLKEMGDGALAKFGTALDAVNCAVEIQELARAKFDGKLRIGIHLGDITNLNQEVYGDGVNIASRLQSTADPGGIYISESIEKAIRGQSEVQAKYLGEINLKNVDYGVRTYAIQGIGLPTPEIKEDKGLSGHLWAEILRRGILRAAITYLLVATAMILLWNLVQYWGFNLPHWSMSILIAMLGIGFPLAAYLAWNFERSPQGFVKTSSTASWRNPYETTQRKPLTGNLIISALVLIIIGMYSYPRMVHSKNPASHEKSIAVLSLDVIGDTEGVYFAEGVREEILNHLSLIEDLNVKSRSVIDRLEASTITTDELVKQLRLTHYLEGSANKVGDKIRVTVQLIDAFTNDHIWAESYDHSYNNLLSTQSEIAKKVADAMQINISPEVTKKIDKKPTDSPQAWDNYLQAEHFWRKYAALRKPADLKNMVGFLKMAIDKDPNFALAYSRLAMAYLQVPFDPEVVFDFTNVDSVLALCDRAIELDSTSGDPYLRRAEYHAYITQDTSLAIKDYKTAISKSLSLRNHILGWGDFIM